MKLIKIGAKVESFVLRNSWAYQGFSNGGDAFRWWLMLKIAEKLDFQAGKRREVRQKTGNQPQIRVFSIIVAEIFPR